MKRWLANITLVVYLGAFSWGIFCHAMSVWCDSHPAMYFFVWDMFCGWSNYERRMHIIGEGESGEYYDLGAAPWGEAEPFGPIGRRHFDSEGITCIKMGLNTLRHTQHEPIGRIFVIEENWAKKYNLPDYMWNRYFTDRKEPTKYCNVLFNVMADGTMVDSHPGWLSTQSALVAASNPKVRMASAKATKFVAVDSDDPAERSNQPQFLDRTFLRSIVAPSAN